MGQNTLGPLFHSAAARQQKPQTGCDPPEISRSPHHRPWRPGVHARVGGAMPPGGGAAAAAAALPRRFNWFPGHMATAMRDIEGRLKSVDLVVEAVDARVPLSGANGALAALAAHKRRIVALNKTDLAEPDTPRARAAAFAPPPSRRRCGCCCCALRGRLRCAAASAACCFAPQPRSERH
jgi:hypothetical protein